MKFQILLIRVDEVHKNIQNLIKKQRMKSVISLKLGMVCVHLKIIVD